jgi:hypothetical protein
MNLKYQPNQKPKIETNNLPKSSVKEIKKLAHQIEGTSQVKKLSKKELTSLKSSVEKNKDVPNSNKKKPQETLKTAIIENFTDHEKAENLLKNTGDKATNEFLAGIESKFGEQLARFAMPKGESEPPFLA